MTRWSIKNLESLQSQESGELVSISRSETNLLKFKYSITDRFVIFITNNRRFRVIEI